jgi:hypothetical protein
MVSTLATSVKSPLAHSMQYLRWDRLSFRHLCNVCMYEARRVALKALDASKLFWRRYSHRVYVSMYVCSVYSHRRCGWTYSNNSGRNDLQMVSVYTLQFPINIVVCTCCVSMLQVFITPTQIFVRWLINIRFPFSD